MLTGDSTDNIQGLPNITQDIADKYCTKVKNGIGPATVNDLFATATTIRGRHYNPSPRTGEKVWREIGLTSWMRM